MKKIGTGLLVLLIISASTFAGVAIYYAHQKDIYWENKPLQKGEVISFHGRYNSDKQVAQWETAIVKSDEKIYQVNIEYIFRDTILSINSQNLEQLECFLKGRTILFKQERYSFTPETDYSIKKIL